MRDFEEKMESGGGGGDETKKKKKKKLKNLYGRYTIFF